MDTRDSLISEQQLEIRKLKLVCDEYKKNLDEIKSILICVGGPLNDRFYHYNKKVEDAFIPGGYYLALPLIKIEKLSYTYDSLYDYQEQDNEA